MGTLDIARASLSRDEAGGAAEGKRGGPSPRPIDSQEGNAGRVVGLFCRDRSVIWRGAGVCCRVHRCVPGQVCAVEVGECGRVWCLASQGELQRFISVHFGGEGVRGRRC